MAVVDKHPQIMAIKLSGSGVSVDTYTQIDAETPVQLLSGTKLLGMNVLRMYFTHDNYAGSIDGDDNQRWQLTKSEQEDILSEDHDDQIIPQIRFDTVVQGTPGNFHQINSPQGLDLSDGKGNGVLITDKTIHLGSKASSAAASTLTGILYLLYTMVNVDAKELLQDTFLSS